MNIRDTITQELTALNSTLPPVIKPVFSVPEGYFENFASSVLKKMKAAELPEDELAVESPLLAGLSRQMPFSVPVDYFSSLAYEIPVLIGNTGLPSILKELSHINPHTVPEGYFETLPGVVMSKVHVKPAAKLVFMQRAAWLRVAAIAAVIGFVTLFYLNSQDGNGTVQRLDTWVANSLRDVSDKALEDFVKGAEVAAATPGVQSAAKAAEVRSLLKDVSDGELEDFLSAVPSDEELILIN